MVECPTELTPFEWSMIQGAENGSMTFAICLGLNGKLDSAAFEAAVASAIAMHPFLSANICSQNKTASQKDTAQNNTSERPDQFYWVPVSDPQPYVSIADWSQPFLYRVSEAIDLNAEIGVRIWVRHGGDEVEIRFQFHHACCDGLGAFRMIEDLLRSYSKLAANTEHGSTKQDSKLAREDANRLYPLDPDVLSLRTAEPEAKLSIKNRILRSTVILPIRITKLLTQKTAAIVASSSVDKSSTEVASLIELPSHTFTQELTESLRSFAKSSGSTLNDLLVRDLFLTIDAWNQASGSKRNRNIRLLIPFSLRTKKHAQMPAANCVSMVYMAANAKLLDDPNAMLASVTRQRKFIRKWQIEHSWNQTAALASSSRLLSGLVQRRAERPIASSVLTNVGQLFCESGLPKMDGKIHCGDLVLNSVVIVPPSEASAPVTFGCNLYADSLTVALNYHQRSFPKSDADRFLSAYVDRLTSSASAGFHIVTQG